MRTCSRALCAIFAATAGIACGTSYRAERVDSATISVRAFASLPDSRRGVSAIIALVRLQDSLQRREIHAQMDGWATFADLQPGQYRIHIRHPTHHDVSWVRSLEPGAHDTVQVAPPATQYVHDRYECKASAGGTGPVNDTVRVVVYDGWSGDLVDAGVEVVLRSASQRIVLHEWREPVSDQSMFQGVGVGSLEAVVEVRGEGYRNATRRVSDVGSNECRRFPRVVPVVLTPVGR